MSAFDFPALVREVARHLARDGVSPATGQGRHVGVQMLDRQIPQAERGRLWQDFLAQKLEAAVSEERSRHLQMVMKPALPSQPVIPPRKDPAPVPAPDARPVTGCSWPDLPPLAAVAEPGRQEAPVPVPGPVAAEQGGRCGTSGLLQSACAHCHPEPEEEPSVYRAVRARIQSGADPDEAVDALLAGFGESTVAQFARPAILAIARNEERKVIRKTEQAALTSSTPESSAARESARLQLPTISFKLPDGQKVSWGTASREDHLARIAWTRTSAATWLGDADLHERAVRLMDEHGVRCLDEIPGWTRVLGSVSADPADAVPPAPSMPAIPVTVPA